MRVDSKDGHIKPSLMVEALLCKWIITSEGQLKKLMQVSFEYDHTYMKTKGQNMRLKLSQDQSIVSLFFEKQIAKKGD